MVTHKKWERRQTQDLLSRGVQEDLKEHPFHFCTCERCLETGNWEVTDQCWNSSQLWPRFTLQGKITLEHGALCLAFWLPHYLVCAPVPQGKDAEAKDHPWPGQVPADRVPEDVEGVLAGSVTLRVHHSVSIGHVGWNGFHVLLHESLIASYLSKCWNIAKKSSNKGFITEISNRAWEREEKSLLNVDIKILSWDAVYYLTHSLVLGRQSDSVTKGLWQYAWLLATCLFSPLINRCRVETSWLR